jgi:uncharacterized protein YggE
MRNLFSALGAILLVTNLATGDEPPKQNTISLSVKGEAAVPAELATINFSIQTENESAVLAEKLLQKKWNILNKELGLLPAADVASVKTCSLITGPLEIGVKNSPSVLVYRQYYSIILRNYSKADDKYIAKLIDELVELDLIECINISFGIERPEKLRKQAYDKALSAAKERASALAESSKKILGKVVTIKDNSTSAISCGATEIRSVVELYVEFELSSE